MARADLHVHSKYSMDGDEWALKALGVRESYSEVEDIYRAAKLAKMDFVAITDHNTIDGALKLALRHPHDTIVGCEFSVFFPETGYKAHLLVYDLDRARFENIMRLRHDIYAVREYLRTENLAHSVAHATLDVNGKLSPEILEKLILLFDVFESVNGAHSAAHNRGWEDLLERLIPGDLERLSEKHGIRPLNENSWSKGLTGGSDDHAGLFIGQTFTVSPCRTRDEFIQCLKDKKTFGFGRHHDPKAMTLSLMLIGGRALCDLTGAMGPAIALKEIGRAISGFPSSRRWILDIIARFLRLKRGLFSSVFGRVLAEVLQCFREKPELTVDQRIHIVYGRLSGAVDLIIRSMTRSVNWDHRAKQGMAWLKKGLMMSAFFGAPLFASFKVLYRGRDLSGRVRLGEEGLEKVKGPVSRRVLWFSELICRSKDPEVLTGAWHFPEGVKVRAAVCTNARRFPGTSTGLKLGVAGFLRGKLLRVPLRIPALLEGLSKIEEWAPDEIVIETPGPMGLLGLAAARLLNVKCYRVFTPEACFVGLRDKNAAENEMLTGYFKTFSDLTDGPYPGARSSLRSRDFSVKRRASETESLECV